MKLINRLTRLRWLALPVACYGPVLFPDRTPPIRCSKASRMCRTAQGRESGGTG